MSSKKPKDKITEINENLSELMDIDKDIHEPARLMILSILSVVESADFVFLRGQTELTWGNLSAHLGKLESKGYITIKKEIKNKKSHTMIRITEKGKREFLAYRQKMKDILS
jgi:DNA-binding MarR family transcriptional regulator